MKSGHFISHDRGEESMAAKARWFQSLTLAERMNLLCEFTELALSLNPGLKDKSIADQAERRIRVLAKE
jgi:hypothetical protein